jgi:hypothetical protein
VQVDLIRPTLKAPGNKRLKLKCDEPLSKIAFNFTLFRYTKGAKTTRVLSLGVFLVSCLLFAFADSKTFDVYIPAAFFLSAGGMGFFFSHFVLAAGPHTPSHVPSSTRRHQFPFQLS